MIEFIAILWLILALWSYRTISRVTQHSWLLLAFCMLVPICGLLPHLAGKIGRAQYQDDLSIR